MKKILWFRADAIGDTVLAFSILPYLNKIYQDALITGFCQNFLVSVYKACPYFSNVIGFDKSKFILDGSYRKVVLDLLRSEKFDIVLNTTYSRELSMDSIATKIGADKSYAFKVNERRGKYDFLFRYNRKYTNLINSSDSWGLEIARYKDFLRALGYTGNIDLVPQVWFKKDDENSATKLLKEHNYSGGKIVVLCAGALSDQRKYSDYGKALELFFKKNQGDWCIVALGAKNDFDINQKNLDSIKSALTINLSGQTTLLQAAACIKKAAFVIGAETGLSHIACALGVKNVVLLGGGHFGRFMPYSYLTTAVSLPLSCYGCNWKCKYHVTHCVQDVSFKTLERALDLLARDTNGRPRVILQAAKNLKKYKYVSN